MRNPQSANNHRHSTRLWHDVVRIFGGFVLLLTVLQIGVVWAAGGLRSLEPVSHNDVWQPLTGLYRGVEMVVVPPGCFMMGSSDGDFGDFDEAPVHEQCFDRPFLIDRFEVTNAQYGSVGGFDRDNRPRELVNWFDARQHCMQRGTRLPTEREWEYAARGPDSLIYPWGDTFVDDLVVFDDNSDIGNGTETWEVGSHPQGASWVSAMDMSGNVWEWVSSAYDIYSRSIVFRYPYRDDDGREDLIRPDVSRSARGGSFASTYVSVRAASRLRLGLYPGAAFDHLGFRCARDME